MTVPKLPNGARLIIERLNSHGKRADIVGGSVRDFLLGKSPSDFDITTSATPDEMREIFSDMRTVDTGIKHGTLTVLIDGVPYEVTTYRKDGEYTDHRHPESVTFSSLLSEDLCRRDFTVNAMCYNEKDGFTDLYGGMRDLAARQIRAVGDPYKRFDEDALRILRAVRFSSTLDFDIDSTTAKAAREMAHLLDGISGERIFTEWKKLVAGKRAYTVIKDFPEVISRFLLPGGEIILPERTAFNLADSTARQLSIFALSAKNAPTAYETAADRMHFDNKTRRCGMTVLENLDTPLNTLSDVNLSFMRIGEECTLALINLRITLGTLDHNALSFAESVIADGLPYALSHLNVSGEDVLSLGIVGKEVGTALNAALEAVIFGVVQNKKLELLNYIKSYTGKA